MECVTLYNDELVNVTYMNNDYLRWNYRYSLAWGTVGDGYFNYNSSTWTMIRNYTTNSYTDSSVFPYCAIRIPDTILLGSGQKLFIDSISNADTILLTSIRSIVIQQFSKPYSWQTRSIDLDTNSVINTPGQSATLTFSIFHHIYDTVNGARYIFIKEYDVTKNVYIK